MNTTKTEEIGQKIQNLGDKFIEQFNPITCHHYYFDNVSFYTGGRENYVCIEDMNGTWELKMRRNSPAESAFVTFKLNKIGDSWKETIQETIEKADRDLTEELKDRKEKIRKERKEKLAEMKKEVEELKAKLKE